LWGEAIADEPQLALLGVLLDGVQELILGDLLLGIGPARDLNNHVEHRLLGVGVEGDVMEGRDGHTVLLDVHAVLKGVGSSHLAEGVRGRHCACVFTRSLRGSGQVTGYLRSP